MAPNNPMQLTTVGLSRKRPAVARPAVAAQLERWGAKNCGQPI